MTDYRARWFVAQRALNKIDDAFEYRIGNEETRAFIHKVLAEYTQAITQIDKTKDNS